jgi:hypothetical protein
MGSANIRLEAVLLNAIWPPPALWAKYCLRSLHHRGVMHHAARSSASARIAFMSDAAVLPQSTQN